jgi:hypothetical protein
MKIRGSTHTAKPVRTKKRADAGKNASAAPDALFVPQQLVGIRTVAEATEWGEAKAQSSEVTLKQTRDAEAFLADSRQKFAATRTIDVRSRKAHAVFVASAMVTAKTLMDTPAVVVALCESHDVRLTRRTLGSPCLPFVKASYPSLDQKNQSHLAQVLNYGLASGLDEEGFRQAVEKHGVVRIAKWERERWAIINGKATAPDDPQAAVRRFIRAHSAVDLTQLALPRRGRLALAVIGTAKGKLVAYAIDDDAKRLAAELRHLGKSKSRRTVRRDPQKVMQRPQKRHARTPKAHPRRRAAA